MVVKVKTKKSMLSGMTPVMAETDYVFVSLSPSELTLDIVEQAKATYQEQEGISLVLPIGFAEQKELPLSAPMRCITLNVYSDLEGVGLTAAVSTELADSNIPCNVIAAYHHDHLYVPSELSEQAHDILLELQKGS
jgi:hypothetical protein